MIQQSKGEKKKKLKKLEFQKRLLCNNQKTPFLLIFSVTTKL